MGVQTDKRRYLGTGHADAAPLSSELVMCVRSCVDIHEAAIAMPSLSTVTPLGLATAALHCFSLQVHKIPSFTHVLFPCHPAVLAASCTYVTVDLNEIGFVKKNRSEAQGSSDHPKEDAKRCGQVSRVLACR